MNPYHHDPMACLEDGQPFIHWDFEKCQFLCYKMPWLLGLITKILRFSLA